MWRKLGYITERRSLSIGLSVYTCVGTEIMNVANRRPPATRARETREQCPDDDFE